MASRTDNRKPKRSHVGLWVAFAFILMLIAWWEVSVPRPANTQVVPVAAVPAAVPELPSAGSQIAMFAGGCFWSVEAEFDKIAGVLSTTSGYMGGVTVNPSYEQVSSQVTGHAETVKVEFDPTQVTYRQLLAHYWRSIDPTARDGQFCDQGTSYRSVIFATSAEQFQLAQASKMALTQSKPFRAEVVTAIEMASTFFPAEAEHQDYHQNYPVRYRQYRERCGRDAELRHLWGDVAAK